MALSQPYKDLIADGEWASGDDAMRELPETAGIVRADGYGVAYEQLQSGRSVERAVMNQIIHEITSALIHLAHNGVPRWDAGTDYVPAAGEGCFALTDSGLWRTRVSTGPTFGNPTDPDSAGQTIWSLY